MKLYLPFAKLIPDLRITQRGRKLKSAALHGSDRALHAALCGFGDARLGSGSECRGIIGQLVTKSDSGALHALCQAPFQSWNHVETAPKARCMSGSGIALAADRLAGASAAPLPGRIL